MAPKFRWAGPGDDPPPATRKRDTSFKLDMLTALMVSDLVKPAVFKVAFALIQHMNSRSGISYPSIETLAAETNLSPRYVQQCIEALRRARWLTSSRVSRTTSNRYQFDETFLTDVLPHWRHIVADRKAARKAAETNNSSGRAQEPTGIMDRPARRTVAPPNTLREHLKRDAG